MSKKQIKIIETCIELFALYGAKKTTMDDIAHDANVSKVTIYKYFGDKESLYMHVGKYILDNYLAEINQQINIEDDTMAKLANIMNIITEYTLNGKMVLCRSLSDISGELKAIYIDFWQKYKSHIVSLIIEGKNKKLIKNEIDNETAFYFIDMGIEYIQCNKEYREKIINDIHFQKNFMRLIIGSIFTKEGEIYN